jgi:hypothetical protein
VEFAAGILITFVLGFQLLMVNRNLTAIRDELRRLAGAGEDRGRTG